MSSAHEPPQLHTDKGQGGSLWNGDNKATFPVGLSVGIKCDHAGEVVSRVPASEWTLSKYLILVSNTF